MRTALKLFLWAALLMTGLCACTDLNHTRIDHEFLTGTQWVEANEGGALIRYWSFQTDHNLFFHYYGSCLGEAYTYSLKGKTLELQPPLLSSVAFEKPFTIRILEGSDTRLKMEITSIPVYFSRSNGLSPGEIIVLKRQDSGHLFIDFSQGVFYPHPADVPGCSKVIATTSPGEVGYWLSFCFYEDTPVGGDLKLERLSFCIPVSSDSRDYTNSFTGRMILKEKTDSKAVITMKDVHFQIAHGEFIVDGDLVATVR